MKRYWVHFRYIIIHKYFVYKACRWFGVSFFTALLHDWSKFTFTEFAPYAKNFFNEDGTRKEHNKGTYDANQQSTDFQKAWLHHQKNKHHWQAWISIGSGGSLSPIEMPEKYMYEMISDWVGAGIAIEICQGIKDTGVKDWYSKNKDKMILHPKTKEKINNIIEQLPKDIKYFIMEY